MSGGSYNYAFERHPEEWYEAVDRIELAAHRASCSASYFVSPESDYIPRGATRALFRFVEGWRVGRGDKYAAKPPADYLLSDEAKAVAKAVEWVTSGDSGWGSLVDAIWEWDRKHPEGTTPPIRKDLR